MRQPDAGSNGRARTLEGRSATRPRQSELDQAVAEIGRNITAVQGDVSNLADLDRLFDLVRLAAGRIDVLFANAGLSEFASLGQITEEHFDKTFRVNVKGTLFTVQKALPLMSAGGSIILTGSTTGIEGSPAFSVYGATKAAIRNFSRSWIFDLKGTGIRVNVLVPGATSTPGLHGLMPTADADKTFTEMLIGNVPLGRMGEAAEVAAAALFLASSDSSFVKGGRILCSWWPSSGMRRHGQSAWPSAQRRMFRLSLEMSGASASYP